MKRNGKLILVSLFLVATLIAPTYARLPATGDHVIIYTAGMINPIGYEGTITEIGNGFVDLMCNEVFFSFPENKPEYRETLAEFNPPKDICIGIGAIIRLEWV